MSGVVIDMGNLRLALEAMRWIEKAWRVQAGL